VVLLFVSMLVMLGAFVDENVEKSSSEEISSINNAFGGGRPITFSGGDGSEENPWHITDLNDLQYLSENSDYWGDYLIQTEDIDASATVGWDGGEGYSPIGNYTVLFTGYYDGQGHIIDGLYIDRVDNNNGFIGRTNGGEIKNIGITNVDFDNWQNIGGLAGFTMGTLISNCYTTGSVTGNSQTGGLIGNSTTGTSINNCYSTCSVNGTNQSGGLIGTCTSISVTNCFSTGSVSSTDYPGGLIGFSNLSTIQNCFWNTTTSTQGSSYGGTGKTTVEMQNVFTFTETDTEGLTTAWDFVTNPGDDTGNDDFWDMDQLGTVNNSYPILSWQEGADELLVDDPLPVTLSSFTAIYNGDNPVIQWITCSEMQNSGWNIYRNWEEDYSSSLKLNINLIPGAGSSTEIHNYTYRDEYDVDNGICYYYWLESISFGGKSDNFGPIALNIPDQGGGGDTPPKPDQYNLLYNYPNPFNPETSIRYDLPLDCQADLSIYNLKGEKIITLVNGIQEAGFHSHIWNGRDENGLEISSGVYIYRIETEYYKMAKTMVLVKPNVYHI
ncbi:MAG: GLUG motif-containing protein, partial [Candidatus Stygibacter frigidus]|nr:GLUG motif-containing protein [Candidatus Stygibacter frigidus]